MLNELTSSQEQRSTLRYFHKEKRRKKTIAFTSIIKHGYTCSVLFVIFINPLCAYLRVKLNNGCFHIEKSMVGGVSCVCSFGPPLGTYPLLVRLSCHTSNRENKQVLAISLGETCHLAVWNVSTLILLIRMSLLFPSPPLPSLSPMFCLTCRLLPSPTDPTFKCYGRYVWAFRFCRLGFADQP